jgi:multidrug efflux pump
MVALLAIMFLRLPTGFLPTEDQGNVLVQFQLPAGATLNRTIEVRNQVEDYLNQYEGKNVETIFSAVGRGAGGAPGGQNTGLAFIQLSAYENRKGTQNNADAISGRASGAYHNIRDAQVYALVPRSAASASRTASPSSSRTRRG